jgi:hypothetical protein
MELNAMNHGLILVDRPYHDVILDLDRSKGVPSAGMMSEYRFIRFCGILMEQVSCNIIDGMANFHNVNLTT